jgi:hypothetical protein
VKDPARYRWTSYRANAHPAYLALDTADNARRMAYRGSFRRPLDDEIISDI